MPELPEVETIVRSLRPNLLGRRIDALRIIRQDIIRPKNIDLASKLTGRAIVAILRRGKKIVFNLDDAARFYIHLGMSGRLTLARPQTVMPPHTHMILRFAGKELRFTDPRRFGGVFWLGTHASPDADLGPEPLKLRPSQLAARLANTRRAIKTALLDQKTLAGLGNIYADESLFAAGIHPQVPANELSSIEIARLNRSIKTVLNRAIHHRGSTLRDYRDANGQPGDFQKIHRVYDRAGKPCVVCGVTIQRLVLGGRSTHFCPKCQPPKR
ncbi:MAG: bifunctional DNA-formamidopyrimidine glycosylase/DNA-(apurinic or apyrimidinic site) lyase [Tepidisphaeraceae bacterium]